MESRRNVVALHDSLNSEGRGRKEKDERGDREALLSALLHTEPEKSRQFNKMWKSERGKEQWEQLLTKKGSNRELVRRRRRRIMEVGVG